MTAPCTRVDGWKDASPARVFVELHAWARSSPEEGWAQLQSLARAAGRSVHTVDGAPIDRPTHQRVELVRTP